jgi:transposase
MIERMIGPDAATPDALAREVGIGKTTLWKWRKQALEGHRPRARSEDAGVKKKSQQQWSAQEKMRVMLTAAALGEEELGAYLRTQGVHEAQLQMWKQEMVDGLEQLDENKRGQKQQASQDSRRIRELEAEIVRKERELGRKDRALSEAAALLLLQKKVRQLWGDEGDDMTSSNES